jgi:hypothetical protein
MKTVIEMAKESGGGTTWWPLHTDTLERFAALVAAPLQERIQDLYKQLDEAERELDSQYKLGMEAEREACAKVCDAFESDIDPDAGAVLAKAIRARGQA